MDEKDGFILIATVTVVLIIFLLAFFLIMLIYRKRKMEHKREMDLINEKHITELLNTQLEVQQQTMQQIGREIHDNVGQKLTLASLYTQQIDYEKKYPEINSRIITVAEIINESLSELRSLSKNMINDYISNTDLITLLRNECAKISASSVCSVTFEEDAEAIQASYAVKNVVVRIAQEFLQNSLKHSACTIINMVIKKEKQAITLYIEDNGTGFSIAEHTSAGVGIHNIKKRSAIIGAFVDFQSSSENGTSLTLVIPIEKLL